MQQRGTGLLLWARRAEDIDRLLHGRGPGATAPQQHAGKQHMRAVSRLQPPYNFASIDMNMQQMCTILFKNF